MGDVVVLRFFVPACRNFVIGIALGVAPVQVARFDLFA